jgi:virulence-associated protein VapD
MYAIAFDLDTKVLEKEYGKPNPNNAYAEIKQALLRYGFTWMQGSVYFGDPDTVNAVSTVVAVQEVAKQLPWFSKAVRDIRMLRIEEYNDLRQALDAVPAQPKTETETLFDLDAAIAEIISDPDADAHAA